MTRSGPCLTPAMTLVCLFCCLSLACSGSKPPPALAEPTLAPFVGPGPGTSVPEMAKDAPLLARAAWTFRGHAAADFPNALKTFSAGRPFDFITKHASFTKVPQAWAYFFSTSLPILTMPSPRTVYAAYYNPYVEAAVITLWSLDDAGRPLLLKATLRSNGEIHSHRTGESNYVPTWLTSDQMPQAILPNQYRQFLRDVIEPLSADPEKAWASLEAVSPDTLDTVAVLSASLLTDLDVLQNGKDEALGQAVRKLTDALRHGDEASLKALLTGPELMPPGNVTKLPPAFRAKVSPVAVVRLKDCALLFLSNPDEGWTYFTVAVETQAPYHMGPLGMFDINYAKPPAPAKVAAGASANSIPEKKP
ncbi:MAG: hypothetical protein NTV86_19235 [Planctomycetota bacterium]|nr:hypothetical protein [Planctomycetota bacterium]